jgi:hypothetical protein
MDFCAQARVAFESLLVKGAATLVTRVQFAICCLPRGCYLGEILLLAVRFKSNKLWLRDHF